MNIFHNMATLTHTQTHTHANTHTDDPHRINFKKPGARRRQRAWFKNGGCIKFGVCTTHVKFIFIMYGAIGC